MSNPSDTHEGGAKAPGTTIALPEEASKRVASASSWLQKLGTTVSWPLMSTMSDTTVKAIKKSTRTPHKQVRFALGAAVGVLTFASLLALVAANPSITFVFTLIGAVVTGLLATLLPGRGNFTTTETRKLERGWEAFETAQDAIEQCARQMREGGLSSAQIESELGARRLRALDQWLTTLAELQGETAAKAAIESIAKTSQEHSLDEPKD